MLYLYIIQYIIYDNIYDWIITFFCDFLLKIELPSIVDTIRNKRNISVHEIKFDEWKTPSQNGILRKSKSTFFIAIRICRLKSSSVWSNSLNQGTIHLFINTRIKYLLRLDGNMLNFLLRGIRWRLIRWWWSILLRWKLQGCKLWWSCLKWWCIEILMLRGLCRSTNRYCIWYIVSISHWLLSDSRFCFAFFTQKAPAAACYGKKTHLMFVNGWKT